MRIQVGFPNKNTKSKVCYFDWLFFFFFWWCDAFAQYKEFPLGKITLRAYWCKPIKIHMRVFNKQTRVSNKTNKVDWIKMKFRLLGFLTDYYKSLEQRISCFQTTKKTLFLLSTKFSILLQLIQSFNLISCQL